jgi:hypothetical protein
MCWPSHSFHKGTAAIADCIEFQFDNIAIGMIIASGNVNRLHLNK